MMNDKFSYNEINEIFLRKKSRYLVDNTFSSNEINDQLVLSICKNIENLGFIFSKELFNALRNQSNVNLVETYKQLVPILTNMLGAHVEHKPFYKNFPQQLSSLTEFELYMNAIVHYWTDGQWIPGYVNQFRFPLEEGVPQIRIIDLGTIDEFDQLFMDMEKGKGSLSIDDQKLLSLYI